MIEWIRAQWVRLYTKKCDGTCGDPKYHDAHLSRLGKWRFNVK